MSLRSRLVRLETLVLSGRPAEEQDLYSGPLTTVERASAVARFFLMEAERKGDQETTDRLQSVIARWRAQAADPAVEAEASTFLRECLEARRRDPDFAPEPQRASFPSKSHRVRPRFGWARRGR